MYIHENALTKARHASKLTGLPAIVQDPSGKIQTFCDLKIRQKALHEALNPPDTTTPGIHPDDLSVARSRRDRTD